MQSDEMKDLQDTIQTLHRTKKKLKNSIRIYGNPVKHTASPDLLKAVQNTLDDLNEAGFIDKKQDIVSLENLFIYSGFYPY